MNKPKHVLNDIWLQHVQWMRLMAEGQLTFDPYQQPGDKTGKGLPPKRRKENKSS